MLRPLIFGGASFVIPGDVIYDASALIKYLEKHAITETLLTPSLLASVLASTLLDTSVLTPSGAQSDLGTSTTPAVGSL